MSELVRLKWDFGILDLFAGIGMVPGRGRYLANGYGADDLIACYAPVAARLPPQCRERVMRFIERTITRAVRNR